jgi:hypothetical protein
MGVCTAETDEDEVAREDSGHLKCDKQRRNSLVRFLVRPVAAKKIALAHLQRIVYDAILVAA